MTFRFLGLLTISCALLAGCATMTFKRGAGPGAAAADEDDCRKSASSEGAYAECLRARGWMVRTPGGSDDSAPAPTAAAVDAAPPPSAGTPRSKTPTSKSAPATAVVPPRAGAKPGAAAATPPPPTPARPDPLTLVTVSSWWKLGGNAGQLDAAVDACVSELGPTHRPKNGPTEVTIALRDCLRAKKWFPVGGSGAK